MTLMNPFALGWVWLAIPIVILYWRKIRLRREPVATGMFWEQVLAEERMRAVWQRWRHPVSLAVQLTILLLVVVALADPQIVAPRRIVLVLDNATADADELAQAKRQAERLIARLRPCDRMAVLSAGGAVSVRCNLSDDRAMLQGVLRAVPVVKGSSRVDEAMELARRMLGDEPSGRLLVLGAGRVEAAKDLTASVPGPLPWLCLAGAAVLLLALEWCLYQRRWMS